LNKIEHAIIIVSYKLFKWAMLLTTFEVIL
jgi:hypothetical protein